MPDVLVIEMADSQAKGIRSVTSFFLLTVLICILIAPAIAEALPDRVYVDASYDENTPDYGILNFSSVQEAIDSVAEGGEVWVYSGTYNEPIVIDRSMTVTTVTMPASLDSPGAIIDALGGPTGVEITAAGVTLSGFEIENASSVGIFAHNADAVTIECNLITIRSGMYGILIADAQEANVGNNEVRTIGSSAGMGIMISRATGACIHDNKVVAVLQSQVPEFVGVEPDPVIAAFALEDVELSFTAELGFVLMRSSGIGVADSSDITIECNRIVAAGNCTGDTPAQVYGIVSSGMDSLKIRENNVTVIGKASSGVTAVGIAGAGDRTLIQENTVQIIAESWFIDPIGIMLEDANKGQVLDNQVDIRATGPGSIDGVDIPESAGIVALDSEKAQICGNNIQFTLTAVDTGQLARISAEGVVIEGCDESQVSDNVVIVNTEIFYLQTDGHEPMNGEESLALRIGEVIGVGIWESDKPEICENLVQVSGTVKTFDEKVPGNLITGAISTLDVTGIHIHGGSDNLITNPRVCENVVIVGAQTDAGAGVDPFAEEVETALSGNSALLSRYAGMMREDEEEFSAVACFADIDGLPPLTMGGLEFAPDIKEAIFAQVYTRTAGIVLEDARDPVVSQNAVRVYQNTFTLVLDLPSDEEEEATCADAAPMGLIDRVFSDGQVQKAAVLSLISDNNSEWQPLSEADRAVVTDAVLSGDAGALRACTEREDLFATDSGVKDTLSGYQTFLENEDPLGFLNATRFAAAVPISVSYGLLYNAEGYVDISENNFTILTRVTILTRATNLAITRGDNLDAPDVAAGSAGLVAASGISGTGDRIRITYNSINVETIGSYLSIATGSDIKTADAAAGAAHLLLSVGVSADAADERIIDNNNITIMQTASTNVQAINEVKDDVALSVAAMAGVGIGIILDLDEVLDDITSYPDEALGDIILGNTISVTDDIGIASIAAMLLPEPLDGSSNALSGAAGAAASFGIVTPEAFVMDNVIDVHANQTNFVIASVREIPTRAVRAAEIDLPGAGALNLGVAVSGGILTMHSQIENNTVFSAANSQGIAQAETEELLENAGAFAGGVAIDIGIMSLNPSNIDGNTVDGDLSMDIICEADGYRVDTDIFSLELDIGILSVGSDATFNNIYNGYMGFPCYYEDEEYEPYADYNWWGDASGPSGFGPGTGSPVIGTMNYEPWLTQPADVVLKTGESYFGLEIGSPNIGGDGDRYGLEPGWNTLSFPLALENNTWQAITHAGDGFNYSVAYSWDATDQRWVQVTDRTRIDPLDAIYIRMNDYDRLPVAISPDITSPPTRALKAGWNLVGPAYNLIQLDELVSGNYLWWDDPDGTSVTVALTNIEITPDGRTGYTTVVSPSINPEPWTYTRNNYYWYGPNMDATYGYWVYVKNPVELVGFSTTPLPMPEWAWAL